MLRFLDLAKVLSPGIKLNPSEVSVRETEKSGFFAFPIEDGMKNEELLVQVVGVCERKPSRKTSLQMYSIHSSPGCRQQGRTEHSQVLLRTPHSCYDELHSSLFLPSSLRYLAFTISLPPYPLPPLYTHITFSKESKICHNQTLRFLKSAFSTSPTTFEMRSTESIRRVSRLLS